MVHSKISNHDFESNTELEVLGDQFSAEFLHCKFWVLDQKLPTPCCRGPVHLSSHNNYSTVLLACYVPHSFCAGRSTIPDMASVHIRTVISMRFS